MNNNDDDNNVKSDTGNNNMDDVSNQTDKKYIYNWINKKIGKNPHNCFNPLLQVNNVYALVSTFAKFDCAV